MVQQGSCKVKGSDKASFNYWHQLLLLTGYIYSLKQLSKRQFLQFQIGNNGYAIVCYGTSKRIQKVSTTLPVRKQSLLHKDLSSRMTKILVCLFSRTKQMFNKYLISNKRINILIASFLLVVLIIISSSF